MNSMTTVTITDYCEFYDYNDYNWLFELLDDGSVQLVTEVLHCTLVFLDHHRWCVVWKLSFGLGITIKSRIFKNGLWCFEISSYYILDYYTSRMNWWKKYSNFFNKTAIICKTMIWWVEILNFCAVNLFSKHWQLYKWMSFSSS